MASPYLVLSALPEVARKFPRTGPWAELVKQFMGFFLLAVALFFAQTWIAKFADPAITYWLIYAVILAGCVFLMAKSIKYAKTRKAPIVAAVISLILLVPGFIVVRKLTIKPYDWRPLLRRSYWRISRRKTRSCWWSSRRRGAPTATRWKRRVINSDEIQTGGEDAPGPDGEG
jgi:thiol:disulfide interchange protein